MRLGVLDVGSNTVHLLVVDVHPGGPPWPAHSEKTVLRLIEDLADDPVTGERVIRLGTEDALVQAVAGARAAADRLDVAELLAFATSAVRDAANGPAVLQRVAAETGVTLRVLSGEDEARVTFLAVRRWFGWSAGRLLVADIGGGSLELAVGADEEPEQAWSLPLGAGRLTRDWLADGDPPTAEAVAALTDHVEKTLAPAVAAFGESTWDRAVATSKVLQSLGRLAGSPPSRGGMWVPRQLTATGLHQVYGFIRHIPVPALATMDGVSRPRAHQLLAGAVVAETLLRRLGIEVLHQCPWALREGLVLRRLDRIDDDAGAAGGDPS